MDVFNYECENQISIFDIIGQEEQKSGWVEGAMNPPVKEVKCKIANECEAYPTGCGGTIEPCRFGGPFKWKEKK